MAKSEITRLFEAYYTAEYNMRYLRGVTYYTAEDREASVKARDDARTALEKALKASAWQEGYDAGLSHEANRAVDRTWPVQTPNPYNDPQRGG